MAKFLIYLFESGLCLSLFYVGYVLFFRKETYFIFNRFYLLGSMILALTVPLVSLPVDVGDDGYLKETAVGVQGIKDYYQHLILLTDPGELVEEQALDPGAKVAKEPVNNHKVHLSVASILFTLYILGVLFFIFRLIYLLLGLRKIIVHAEIRKEKGLNLVFVREEIPSFSFLKWIFVNPNILKPEEYEQVLTHEKVHVEHKHSVDLLLAQIITIFQWFNPLTWRIQKSIKTCHEYIADRQVVHQGYGLFDYQSLLLSQLISIRSVELVNNFNLLSIKKRIAMMNKHKSGKWAQMKAIAIVPIVIAAFFLFADMTSRNENLNLVGDTSKNTEILMGSWISENGGEGITQLVEIKSGKMVAIVAKGNDNIQINEYDLKLESNRMVLTRDDKEKEVAYRLDDGVLTIDWGKEGKQSYTRSNEESTYTLLGDQFQKFDLPYATQLHPYKKEMVLCTISLSGDKLFVDGKACKFSNLEKTMIKLRDSADQSKITKMTVLLNIDKDATMKYVDKVKTSLRDANVLKLGYLAQKKGETGNDYMALFNLLPPKDALWVDKEDMKKRGIPLFEIDKKFVDFSDDLESSIKANKKYVMLYEYDNQTTYNDYIQTLDLVYATIIGLRRNEAFFDSVKYDDLSSDEQKVYRKKYPITLTMKNSDED